MEEILFPSSSTLFTRTDEVDAALCDKLFHVLFQTSVNGHVDGYKFSPATSTGVVTVTTTPQGFVEFVVDRLVRETPLRVTSESVIFVACGVCANGIDLTLCCASHPDSRVLSQFQEAMLA